MAKRFTDSEKWKNPWFRTLPGAYRWLWIYICDNCDAAGIWMADFETASYFIGEIVSLDEALRVFGDKVLIVDGDKWFIPSFIKFQYGALRADSRPHLSVIKILEKFGINHETLALFKGYPKGINTLKDKDKDKEQDKDKDKDKEQEQEKFAKIEKIYSDHYPLKKGKSDGIKKAMKDLRTESDIADFEKAVKKYAQDCQGKDPQYIKHFETFVNSSWRDLLDENFGKASVTPINGNRAQAVVDRLKTQAERIAAGEL